MVSSTLTKMSIIFSFIPFLLAMSEVVYIYPGVVTPAGRDLSPPPLFFLGVAIGLELRIRL